MKYISRILLFIFTFLISIVSSFAVDNALISIESKATDTISAVEYYHHDIINSKDNEFFISNITEENNLYLNNRKNSNLYDGGINNSSLYHSKQFKYTLFYIYTLSYLTNKTSSVHSFLSFEIQPNAP